jgi:crotonobetainyl-CoA:carnitine CoA-transferase CaiB-like acyl-CoA transferase
MRVLEISDREEAAAYCTKLFARWGAEVLKVERPGRLPASRNLDIYLNGGKRRVALDPGRQPDLRALTRLADEADVIVTDYSPRQTEELRLLELGGRSAVRASITPFGLSGPYRDYEATSATLLALGGYTWLMGDPGREPLTLPGNYPYYQGGTFAYVAALSSYLAGQASRIDVSVLECLASLHQFTDTMYLFGNIVRSRHGNRWENLAPTTLLQCHDGWYGVNILPNFWFSFAHMIGLPDAATEGTFATNAGRMDNQDELEAIITRALWHKPRKTIFKEGQEVWRVPVGYAATMADLLEDPHLKARGFWRRLEDGQANRDVLVPGSPFTVVGESAPLELPTRPAASDEPRFIASPATKGESAGEAGLASRPLAAVRILDLTRIWSGPLATRILGDLGAEVVKIEAHEGRGGAIRRSNGQPIEGHWNRQGLFNKLSRNKQGIAIDLKAPAGRDIFLRLVEKSDVVIENFSARAMPSLSLSYEQMRSVNPGIIYVPMPAFGLNGPYRDYIGLGPSIEPVTGMTAVLGYSDDEPRVTSKAITDAIAGTTTAAAVLMALKRRHDTGAGCMLDLSQHETGIAFMGEHVIEAQLAGREPARRGNPHPELAPHGVYRCSGEDDWIAIAVRSEAEWVAFCRVLRAVHLINDARFVTREARLANATALNEEVNAQTASWNKRDLERALQARGIAAGAVLTPPEWLSDPHLEARRFFVELEHREAGTTRWDGLGVIFDGVRDYEGWKSAPCLGEHNRSALASLLGLTDAELDGLYEQRILAEEPPLVEAE